MKVNQVLKNIEIELADVMFRLPAIITHKLESTESDDEQVRAAYSITTKWGEYTQLHSITLVYNIDMDEYGIDLGTPDNDISEITESDVMTKLYFDLAFKNIADEDLI